MRLLFVSGVATGGAPKSTLELGRKLSSRGHDVRVLLTERPSWTSPYGVLVRAHEKSDVALARSALKKLLRRFGRRVSQDPAGPLVLRAKVAENAVRTAIGTEKPDIVIGNSLPRFAAMELQTQCRNHHIPYALYLREEHAISHFTITGLRPDLVVANAQQFVRSLATEAVDAHFVPSIVDLQASRVESSRRSILMINPIAENRPEMFHSFALARPDLNFVLQESWPLDPTMWGGLKRLASSVPNLDVRPRTSTPAEVYRDAALLVASYPSGRPRVVLEAHDNGIPVVALDQPAIGELVSPKDTLVPLGAPDSAWLEAIEQYVDNPTIYSSAEKAARAHAARPGIAADSIVANFEALVRDTITSFRSSP